MSEDPITNWHQSIDFDDLMKEARRHLIHRVVRDDRAAGLLEAACNILHHAHLSRRSADAATTAVAGRSWSPG